MGRPTEIRPGTPTEELLLADGWAVPIEDERAVGAARAGTASFPTAQVATAPIATAPAAGDSARIGGGRRTLLAGLAVGALVLAVAGAGWAGRSAEPAPGAPSVADPLPPSPGEPARNGAFDTDGSIAGDAEQPAVAASAGFPVEADGLLVTPVEAVSPPARSDGARPIAVAGWLSVEDASPTGCVVPGALAGSAAPDPGAGSDTGNSPTNLSPWPPGSLRMDPRSRAADFCYRVAVLRAAPGTGWDTAHLHPQFLPGLTLGALPDDPGGGVPVVLIGHFNDERALACQPGGRHCGEDLVVDRLAWAAGRELPQSLALAPGLRREVQRSPARAGSIVEFYGTVPLRTVSVAGVKGADLGQLDADAASVVAAGGRTPELAWYVRFIVPDAVNGRVNWTTGWAVVDDASGLVVARAFG